MTSTVAPVTEARLRAAHRSVLVVFALAGIAFAAWASRIADAKHALHLTPGQLGAVLLATSAGSLIALPSAGRIVGRVGVATTIRIGLSMSLVGLTVVGIGVSVASVPLVAAGGLFVVGSGIGIWDVSMNLEGATVERLLGRTTMPLYHASFSGGTVASAFVGALMSWRHVSVLLHLVAVAVLVLAVGVWQLRDFLPRELESEEADTDAESVASGERPRSAWLEPRTLLVGLVVLAAAFTEGTANDWLSVAFVDGHDLPTWAGVLAFAVFLSAMTVGRIVGTSILDRHGRVPVVRATFVLAVVGSLMVVFGPAWLAYAGAAVWGVGASLGFPVGMSASADDPKRAAARMSTVATIGYAAFIAGPPLLGFLGDHFGVLRALLAVTVLIAVALLVVPAVAPLPRSTRPDAEPDVATGGREAQASDR
ncbi:putative integral membrane protein [Nostocoides japonicum T1-X7]|uniref:Putative integral membrane protein n=1 Tax=Nostocoides japonicum T1-X7 TaxID=1194083 RepID=A0A077M197_9MICO|nr:MFS transporter [Tetrasphaera japonica]CCH80103.1 putative integral membrane protein [Tetrasphaera japonica T1-X7]